MNKTWKTCGIPSNGPTYAWWEYQKEKTLRKEQENVFEEIVAKTFPTPSSINSESYSKTHYHQIVKTQRQRKDL